ncbi:MAG: ABC transporter permease [Thermoplasmatota archaeon]
MRISRSLMVTKKTFWSLRHDKRTAALIIIAPVMAMFIFGLAFSGEIHDVEVVVLNQDRGFTVPGTNTTVMISQMILQNVDGDKVNIRYTDDPGKGEDLVRSGECNSLVIFPSNFTSGILSLMNGDLTTLPDNSSMRIRSDRSQVNVATEVQRAFADAAVKTAEDQGWRSPLDIDTSDPIYGENARFIDMFVPGIMGFVIFLMTTLLTLVSFVGERTRGTLSRLLASPVTEGEVVAGYAAAFSMIGMIQVGILLTIAILVFDIIVVGNPLIAFLLCSILAVVSVSLGILLSSFARRESQAIQFLPIVILPVFLLSGVFWPIQALPQWLRPLSYAVPVTYAVDALRSVLLRGWGLGDIWLDLTVLLGFAVVFLFGAVASLKLTMRK